MTANAFGKQKKKTRLINQSNVSDILNDVMAACIVIRSWRRAIHHLLTSDWSHYLAGALPLGPPHSLPLKTASPKLGNIPKVRKHSAEVFFNWNRDVIERRHPQSMRTWNQRGIALPH
ncbi:unnamed protein product [Arctogadus glacialis]